jgi:small conductance mechanosensitive channel
MAEEDGWKERILEPPTVAGVESVTGTAVTIRVVVKCSPNEHLGVQRELRERIKAAFDREGVRVPPPVFPGSPGPL